MRKLGFFVTAVAVAFASLATPTSASVGNDSTYEGGCSFITTIDPTGQTGNPDTFHGLLSGGFVLYSAYVPGNPVSADVRCEIRVNGVPVVTGSSSGTGLVALANFASYVARPGDIVTMCTIVDYTGPGDTTPTVVQCAESMNFNMPPEEVFDLLNRLFIDIVDPVLCPILVTLAPLSFGLIEPDGDIDFIGWNCPPYTSRVPTAT